jgi:hypothetical protein
MNPALLLIGLAFLAQPAPADSDIERVEEAIRQALVADAAVVFRVEMERLDADNLAGFADIRDAEGHEGRLGCTARRSQPDSLDFNCLPMITDQIVTEMEGDIRHTFAAQDQQVVRIDLDRQDDMRMNGYALVRGSDGTEVRTRCTVLRENPRSRTFNWECLADE